MAAIRLKNLRRVDLNLLVTLDALLSERHVTRAAERLHLSQPAVSVRLARLRRLFADPLLVPGPRGMTTTARADALKEPLHDALDVLRRAVAPDTPFEASAATETWNVAAADYGSLAVMVPTIARLRAIAPHTRLALREVVPARVTALAADGEIDLGLTTMDRVARGMHVQKLFDERYVLVGRRGHPKLERRPTLARFCALEHVMVSPDGGGFSGATDAALDSLGRSRKVVLSVPHFNVVLAAIRTSDLVAMLPRRLVQGMPELLVLEAPLAVPGFEFGMTWHERRDRDPAHRWLREQIATAIAA